MTGNEPVAVIGAGLAGCLLATLLGRRGLTVTVYERRADPRVTGAERGRSINLAISARGLAALEQVGLAEQALGRALPMRGRLVHPKDGPAGLQPYSADGRRSINSISRAELNASLLDAAEHSPGVTLRFEHRLHSVDAATGELSFHTAAGERAERSAVVLACDGAYSATRLALAAGFGCDLQTPDHGYKELTIPARRGQFALDPGALHIWPRTSSMMIALPNVDRSFTCTLFWPKTGPGGLDSLDTAEQIAAHFRAEYPDVVDLMPTLVEDYQRNPVSSLVTVRCWPWVQGRVALVGDAAHAILPFFGQGANCAFEDCIEIDHCLDHAGGDWDRALQAYQQRRKANTDAIAALSEENFVEMRDKVSSRLFQLKSQAEHSIERHSGGRYLSRYELVSFSTLPYARIAGRLRRQRLALLGMAGAVIGALLALRGVLRRV